MALHPTIRPLQGWFCISIPRFILAVTAVNVVSIYLNHGIYECRGIIMTPIMHALYVWICSYMDGRTFNPPNVQFAPYFVQTRFVYRRARRSLFKFCKQFVLKCAYLTDARSILVCYKLNVVRRAEIPGIDKARRTSGAAVHLAQITNGIPPRANLSRRRYPAYD